MRALLIEFDLNTGKRAGNISPKDPTMLCHGWQNLENKPALEIRLIEDSRDASVYAGVPGITLLEGKEAINRAIEEHVPCQCAVKDSALMIASAQEKGLALIETFGGKTPAEIARIAFDLGLAGVVERRPQLID